MSFLPLLMFIQSMVSIRILFFFLMLPLLSIQAQNTSEQNLSNPNPALEQFSPAEDGTFQIMLNSEKEKAHVFDTSFRLEISRNRASYERLSMVLDGWEVLILSAEEIANGLRVPLFMIIE